MSILGIFVYNTNIDGPWTPRIVLMKIFFFVFLFSNLHVYFSRAKVVFFSVLWLNAIIFGRVSKWKALERGSTRANFHFWALTGYTEGRKLFTFRGINIVAESSINLDQTDRLIQHKKIENWGWQNKFA